MVLLGGCELSGPGLHGRVLCQPMEAACRRGQGLFQVSVPGRDVKPADLRVRVYIEGEMGAVETAGGRQSFIKTKQQARLRKWGHAGLTFGVWPRSTNIISNADSRRSSLLEEGGPVQVPGICGC